jgi:hypothetical protein
MERSAKEELKRRQDIAQKAGDHHLRPGAMHQNRYIDPLDYERWEKSRAERKAKKHTLDPYR